MQVGQRPFVPIGRVVIGGLIVVGICSILCWRLGWCWWCPHCPDVDCCDGGGGEAAAQIILEDMHAGVWMAMDNSAFMFGDLGDDSDGEAIEPRGICADSGKSFGECEGHYESGPVYRHGVLFQTGPMVQYDPDTGLGSAKYYAGVYIEHDAGSVWMLAPENIGSGAGADFDWLDVMETGTNCVIDPYHAYEMVHHVTDYSALANHLALHSTTTEDLRTNECDAVNVTTAADLACPRDRSVHASVLPTRIITYWAASGSDFYDMEAGPTTEIKITKDDGSILNESHGDSHVSYTFKLPEKVVVDRWKDGCIEERYTGVTLIRILYHQSALFHLGYPHKPIDGELGL